MNRSVTSLARQAVSFSIVIGLSAVWVFAQTSTDCPAYAQMDGDKGMANNASISVQMVDNSVGQWDTDNSGAQEQTVQQSLSNFTSAPGSNQTISGVENTDTEDLSGATPATPVMVMSMATQTTLDATCATAAAPHPQACTGAGMINGTVIYTETQVTPSYAAAFLAAVTGHELGGHGDYGWDDCSGNNCTNSIMNPFLQPSVTGPTNCDLQQAKKCGR